VLLDRATFIDALRESTGSADTTIESRLWDATEGAAAAYSQIAIEASQWTGALARALAAATETPDGLDAIRFEDLFLATALTHGNPSAIAVFEEALLPVIDRALNRFRLDPDERSELCQRVRIRLLVSESGAPAKISTYVGIGPLNAWLRTVTARVVVSLQRRKREHEPLEEVPDFAIEGTPEAATLRSEGRALFVDSLKQAFRELEPRERTLLRLRYAEDMTLASLAQAYGVHESTMSRRLASARSAMAQGFRRLAGERLGTTATADALGLVQSRIETSLETLLASRDSD